MPSNILRRFSKQSDEVLLQILTEPCPCDFKLPNSNLLIFRGVMLQHACKKSAYLINHKLAKIMLENIR